MGVRLLGTVKLAAEFHSQWGGISDLAWDADEGLLYAVSDRGWLFHLSPTLDADRLTHVELEAAWPLRSDQGKPLRGTRRDAEGMAALDSANGIKGDTRLAIGFEHQVRIDLYTPQGRHLSRQALPAPLRRTTHYRSANLALEALVMHPSLGLVTGPERSLRDGNPDHVRLFDVSGRQWLLPLLPTPNASLVALESLPDGSVLVLERGHGALLLPFVIGLRRVELPTIGLPGAPGHGSSAAFGSPPRLSPQTLAIFNSAQGWNVDNYEGLARHRQLRFFMASDDNFRPFQRSLLTYFELVLPLRDWGTRTLNRFMKPGAINR